MLQSLDDHELYTVDDYVRFLNNIAARSSNLNYVYRLQPASAQLQNQLHRCTLVYYQPYVFA